MDPDHYLAISGLQHFSFCRRQWALIHLEQQWSENLSTAEGRLQHERCHDDSLREKRGGLLIVRALQVVSHRLRLTGVCDACLLYTSIARCRTSSIAALKNILSTHMAGTLCHA